MKHKFYHISGIQNKESILKNGLIPGDFNQTFYFFVPEGASVLLFAEAISSNQIFENEFSIFETEFSFEELSPDMCYEFTSQWQYKTWTEESNTNIKHIGDYTLERVVCNTEVLKDIQENSDYEISDLKKKLIKLFSEKI